MEDNLAANGAEANPPSRFSIVLRRQGIPGAYSEDAKLKAYPKSETVPCEQFEAAFKTLAQCEMMLSKLGIINVSADGTAGAAQMVVSSVERDSGAVASP